MYYSLIGFLALLILLITNHDVIFQKIGAASSVQRLYRGFLFSVMAFYVTDILWGLFDSLGWTMAAYFDTELYFIALAFSVYYWTQFVIAYLDVKNVLQTFLHYVGITFFIGVTLITVINLCAPIMFWIDENGVYQTGAARHVVLIVQIVILFLTAANALYVSVKTQGTKRNHHLTVGLSGVIMLVCISIQIFFPLIPLYSMAYMLGNCLLRTFVIENERAVYREELETSLKREQEQLKELKTAWELAYTDALTGAKSKLAYAEKEDEIDKDIMLGSVTGLAVAVFDVNGLKNINDTKGHDVGDTFIINAYRLICECFRYSAVFRIGGDEFVAILEGADFMNRNDLLELFNRKIEENRIKERVVVSAGLAEFIPEKDNSYKPIFERADHKMYERKEQLKATI